MNELNYRIDYGTSACATYAQVHVLIKMVILGIFFSKMVSFQCIGGLLIEEIRVININFYDKETLWDTSLSF